MSRLPAWQQLPCGDWEIFDPVPLAVRSVRLTYPTSFRTAVVRVVAEQPGQACSDSWMNWSQSKQKSFPQSEQEKAWGGNGENVGGWALSLPSSRGKFSQPFQEKCISKVVRIDGIMNFHLSKLWKAKFSIPCGVIFLVRLQRKFEVNHSWEWKG